MTDLFAAFEPLPQPMRMPQEPIVRSADIEPPYRWMMTRAWGPGPCISWTLFNPSDADGARDDPTTQRMMGFSHRWGFGTMVVTNVYPFIASKPGDLWSWRSTWAMQPSYGAWLHNRIVVNEALTKSETHVAAWGNGPRPDDLKDFLQHATIGVDTSEFDGFGIVQVPVEWKCLGHTLGGAPKHPLARGPHRVSDDAQLTDWRSPDVLDHQT